MCRDGLETAMPNFARKVTEKGSTYGGGAAAFPPGSSSDMFVGAITLPVILLVYAFVRHLRNMVL
jgi:hypothetical protein